MCIGWNICYNHWTWKWERRVWLRGARSHLHHRRPSEDEMKFISRGSGKVGKAGTALAKPWGHEEPSYIEGWGKFQWQEPGLYEMGRSRDAAGWGRSENSYPAVCFSSDTQQKQAFTPIHSTSTIGLEAWLPDLHHHWSPFRIGDIFTTLWTPDYVRLHRKRELRLHMELSLQIYWPWNGEIIMDSMNGPSMITGVPKSGRERELERGQHKEESAQHFWLCRWRKGPWVQEWGSL